MGVYLMGASLAQILIWMHTEDKSFHDAITKFPVPFAMVFFGLIEGLYPLSLVGYHLFLIGRGETTREYLQSHKFARQDRHRPYTQGIAWKNWLVVLLRPRPPTYLRFKSRYEEGDRRFSEKRQRDVKRAGGLGGGKNGNGGGVEMTSVSARPAAGNPATAS
jgi:palmitoyltransferase ZDHHC9/14/18